MRVLSLFDGISCGCLALERAGVPVEIYYASEIDKYALSISNKNYPDIIRIGDVRNVDFRQFIGKVDLIIGGSPCQDLSIAKKNRKGLSGERSGLFWRFAEAVRIIKPKYFLLENVASMSKENCAIITETLGVEPILINSALVSAQQRKRLYWCNWAVGQPEDKNIFLRDVLESGLPYTDKSYCLTSNYKGAYFEHGIRTKQRSMVAEPLLIPENTIKGYAEINVGECFDNSFPQSKTRRGRKMDKKSNCLTAMFPQFFQYIGCALRSRHHKKQLEVRKDQKSNAITHAVTDSMVCRPIKVGSLNGKTYQGNRVYSVRGKSIALSANGGGLGAKTGLYKIDLPDGDYYVRKLTPVECERLQTLPDNYTDGVSKTQRYKMIGNAWTVDVIAHIFRELKKDKRHDFNIVPFI